MYFSPQGEKIPKELLRLSASNSYPSAGKHIPTAPDTCLCSQVRTSHQRKRKAIYTRFKCSDKIRFVTMQCSALQGNHGEHTVRRYYTTGKRFACGRKSDGFRFLPAKKRIYKINRSYSCPKRNKQKRPTSCGF